MTDNIEYNIFNLAINSFNNDKDIQLEIETEEKEKTNNGYRDGKIVKIKYQKKELLYCAEVKQNINNTIIALLSYRKETTPHPLLIITKYVNNIKAEELKKNGIQFIDTVGNAYLNYYPIYIFIKGNKLPDKLFETKTHLAFGYSGLKIVYALLCNADLVKKPYRYIAEITGVALGTVGNIINDLINLGFVLEMGSKGRELHGKKELFTRWCVDFSEKLRSKLLINKFSGPDNWWVNYKLNPLNGQWGGEVAANKLTKYLKPQNIIVYAERKKYQNIIIENKLRKDNDGSIELLERFWKSDLNSGSEEIVDPILIYADLVNINNQRVLETARIIYEEYIDRHFRET